MSNGITMLNELDFTRKIKAMPDRDLLEFVAEQVFEQSQRCPKEDERITALENRDKKWFGGVGGVGGIIGGVIVGLFDFFTKRGAG